MYGKFCLYINMEFPQDPILRKVFIRVTEKNVANNIFTGKPGYKREHNYKYTMQ